MRLLPGPVNTTLASDLETERLHLKSLGFLGAIAVTNSWRYDPEILVNFYRSSKKRSLRKWIKHGPIPNNRTRFTHAIVPKNSDTPIGAHAVKMFEYRSASMTVAIHDREWWGKGVVLEARVRLINHFFKNTEIERFIASVNGRNTGSIFNYRRLGFSHAGTMHRSSFDPVSNEVIDIVNFELFRERWESGRWSDQYCGDQPALRK